MQAASRLYILMSDALLDSSTGAVFSAEKPITQTCKRTQRLVHALALARRLCSYRAAKVTKLERTLLMQGRRDGRSQMWWAWRMAWGWSAFLAVVPSPRPSQKPSRKGSPSHLSLAGMQKVCLHHLPAWCSNQNSTPHLRSCMGLPYRM